VFKQILTITLLSVATATVAADLPKRKSGLWEITSASSARANTGKGAMAMTMCVDQNSDADWMQGGRQMSQTKCSKQEHKVERDPPPKASHPETSARNTKWRRTPRMIRPSAP